MAGSDRRFLSSVYTDIQSRLDSLIGKIKITPSELHVYANSELDELLEVLGLVPDSTNRKVCLDIVSHLYNASEDTISTFESFRKIM